MNEICGESWFSASSHFVGGGDLAMSTRVIWPTYLSDQKFGRHS